MSEQQEFDWAYFDRQGWIKEAVLPSARAEDGSAVSASAMKSILHAINDRLGDNAEAWPSRETIARDCGLSVKTVTRAAQALESLSLLIRRSEVTRGGWRRKHYRIVWTELQILDPRRRQMWAQMLSREPKDILTEPKDILTEPKDILTEPKDTMSHELLTNSPKKNSKNSPPPRTSPSTERAGTNRLGESASAVVVVSDLISLGMSSGGARKATEAATGRGLSPDEIASTIQMFRDHRGTNPDWTVGHLYNWLAGRRPTPTHAATTTRPATTPRRTYTTSTAERRSVYESRVTGEGLRSGLDGPPLDEFVRRRLAKFDCENPPVRTPERQMT